MIVRRAKCTNRFQNIAFFRKRLPPLAVPSATISALYTALGDLALNVRTAARETVSTPLYYCLAALTGAFALAVRNAGIVTGEPARVVFHAYDHIVYATSFVALGVFIVCRVLYIMIVRRPDRLTHAIGADLGATCFNPRRVLNALPILFLFPIFFSVFTSFKSILPDIRPYTWDPTFVRVDAFLHGGRQAWQVLQPALGFAYVSLIINYFYQLWFFTKFFVLYWQSFSRADMARRAQFFLTLLTAWIVNGVFFALIFSSAGPCYYALIHPGAPDPFAPLMAYFAEADKTVPMWNLLTQARLWDIHQGNITTALAGISAFPSMHVSVAFTFLLAAWPLGGAWRACFMTFFMFTLIGSIHLGWHYAADGYFSVLTTTMIWLAWGRLVQRFSLHRPRWGSGERLQDIRENGKDLVDLRLADDQGR